MPTIVIAGWPRGHPLPSMTHLPDSQQGGDAQHRLFAQVGQAQRATFVSVESGITGPGPVYRPASQMPGQGVFQAFLSKDEDPRPAVLTHLLPLPFATPTFDSPGPHLPVFPDLSPDSTAPLPRDQQWLSAWAAPGPGSPKPGFLSQAHHELTGNPG